MNSSFMVHVVNTSRGEVSSYQINSKPIFDRFGELETQIISRKVTTPAFLVQQTQSAYNMFRRVSSAIDVPASSGFGSAWDVSQNTSNRGALDNWFENNSPIKYWSIQISSIFGGALISALDQTEWLFRFQDGTSLVMVAATTRSSKLIFTYKDNSAEDKDGNRIPDAGASPQGEYIFRNESSLNEYLNKLRSYGIRVVVIRSGSSGGRPKVIIKDIKRK